MASLLNTNIDEQTKEKGDLFLKKITSEMHFKSEVSDDSMAFDWLDEIEKTCPFIDNVVRHPKLVLIQDENVVKSEKAKRITVASIKDLTRHTNYISKVNEDTKEVEPSRILDIRSEETFNIYENRFLYTLIDQLNRFIMKKEDLFGNSDISNDKVLEYVASTLTDTEKVNIELRVTSGEIPKGNDEAISKEEMDKIILRIKRVREYITSWQKSDMVKALDKAHIALVNPPIKKTNIILKNPNFQMAMKLYTFLQKYDYIDQDNTKEGLQTSGNENLKSFLDHSFLLDYFVLDSIVASKREQRANLAKYAVYILTEEINRTMNLLINNGVKITDEQLLDMIAKAVKSNKNSRLVGVDDVKKKFKSVMDEYLERAQDYL